MIRCSKEPFILPESPCTACGKKMDRATGVGHNNKPDPGDITICLTCGHIMVYADDLSLRDPTNSEMVEIAGDKRILAVMQARKMMGKQHRNSK